MGSCAGRLSVLGWKVGSEQRETPHIVAIHAHMLTFHPLGFWKLMMRGLPLPFTNSAWKSSPLFDSGFEKPPPHATCNAPCRRPVREEPA